MNIFIKLCIKELTHSTKIISRYHYNFIHVTSIIEVNDYDNDQKSLRKTSYIMQTLVSNHKSSNEFRITRYK